MRGLAGGPITGSWRGLARGLIGMLALVAAGVAAGVAAAPRVGPDIEDFNPPYTRADPLVAGALAAYDAEKDAESERLARAYLAKAAARKSAGRDFARVEGLFLLARALDGQRRLTEGESAYRQGIAILKPLIGAKGKDAKARDWARYFEIMLRDNLEGQGRFREADLAVSIIPPDPAAAPAGESKTERGVMWMPGVKTSPCPGSPPVLRALDAAEAARRDALDRDAETRAAAGDGAGAEAALRALLALDAASFGPGHCESAVDHRRLANALLAQNKAGEAASEARRALAIFDALAEDHRETVYALQALAEAVRLSDGAAAAEPFHRRALAIFERRRGADSRETLFVRLDLAANLYAQDRFAESEAVYRRALTAAEGSYIDQALALDIRGFAGYLAALQGELARAVGDYRAVCARRAELIAQSGRGGAASGLKTSERDEAGKCALRHALTLRRWADAGGGPDPADRPDALRAEAFTAAQSALPSSSAEALARAGARIAAATSGVGDLAERYEAAIRERDASGQAPRPLWLGPAFDPAPPAGDEAAREARNQAIAEMAVMLAREAPLYWDIRSPRALDAAALQARSGPDKVLLGKDEALILLMVPPGARHGLVFAVSKEAIGWDVIGLSGAELKALVGQLRGDIDTMAYGIDPAVRAQGPGFVPFDRALSYRLYQALFGGSEIQRVIAKPRTLIIVPSGPLTTLPPGLLVASPPAGDAVSDDPATMRATDWLLRKKAIALLPSVASLRTLRQLAPRRGKAGSDPLLAFADPDFAGTGTPTPPPAPVLAERRGRTRGYSAYFRDGQPFAAALRELPPLPQTRIEGMALAAALGATPASVLTGADATKAELLRRNADGRLGRARIIEFATHGLVAGEGDGLAEPALVLAAGPSAADWLLKASEAATLRINADWVLLSACNTASPDAQDAEGLSGLMRAFFYAGSSALLVSHWTIGDDVSARLVPATIRRHRIGPNVSRAAALQAASLAILDDPSREEYHPVYWAPFTLVGDPR